MPDVPAVVPQPVPGETTAEAGYLRACLDAAAEHPEAFDLAVLLSRLRSYLDASEDMAGVAAARERDAVVGQVRQFRDKHNPELNHVCCVSDLLFALLGGDGDQP